MLKKQFSSSIVIASPGVGSEPFVGVGFSDLTVDAIDVFFVSFCVWHVSIDWKGVVWKWAFNVNFSGSILVGLYGSERFLLREEQFS